MKAKQRQPSRDEIIWNYKTTMMSVAIARGMDAKEAEAFAQRAVSDQLAIDREMKIGKQKRKQQFREDRKAGRV